MKRATRLPRALAIATRLAYSHAKSSGAAVGPLLAQANLSRRQIEDTKLRLRVADQVEFLNVVSSATGDDLLGFHLAQRFELREGGLFYYVLASSATLFEVCQRTARYSVMVNEGVVQNFVDGRLIGIELGYGPERHPARPRRACADRVPERAGQSVSRIRAGRTLAQVRGQPAKSTVIR